MELLFIYMKKFYKHSSGSNVWFGGSWPSGNVFRCTYSFGKLNSIGVPVEGVSIEIRDSNNNIVDKPFQIGELVISSNSIMEGYLFLGSESKAIW